MNHKKIIIGILIFLVVAVIILFVAKAAKDKKAQEEKDKAAGANNTPAPPTTATPPFVAPATVAANGFPIVPNVFNENVKALQSELGVKVDGIFGANTLAKLRLYIPDFPANFSITSQSSLNNYILTVKNKRKQLVAGRVNPNWMQII